MLEIKNLVVQIEDKRILNGLDLTVNKGEVAAIMGGNWLRFFAESFGPATAGHVADRQRGERGV